VYGMSSAAGGNALAVAVVFAPLLKQTLNQPPTRKPTLATPGVRRGPALRLSDLNDGEVILSSSTEALEAYTRVDHSRAGGSTRKRNR
jgi:hypothetical protein